MRTLAVMMAVVLGACGLLVCGSASGSKGIPQVLPESPQRTVAEEWVGLVDRGNQRGACELQASGQLHGTPCVDLPTRELLNCPKVSAGGSGTPSGSSERIRLPEQLGTLTQEGASRAYVLLKGRRKGSKWRGALGVESSGGSWKITYLRQGSETFSAAADVWSSRAWHRLFDPVGCPK